MHVAGLWNYRLLAAAGCHPVVKNRIKKAEKNNKRRDTNIQLLYHSTADISPRAGPFCAVCVADAHLPLSLICGSFFCFVLILFRRWIEESRVLSYPLCVCVCVCAVYVYMHVRVCVLSVRIKWGPSASSLICFLFCFFFSLYTKWAEMPWIRKQLGGDLRRDRRCKTHKRPVVKNRKLKSKKEKRTTPKNTQRASQKVWKNNFRIK